MERRGVLVPALAWVGAMLGLRAAAAKSADTGTATCGVAQGHPPMQKYLQSARRMPKLPERGAMSPDELPAYDHMGALIAADGGVNLFPALALAPRTGAAVVGKGGLLDTLLDYEGLPGHVRAIDHQSIDMTIALDAGYYSAPLVNTHTPQALAAGIKMQTLEALRDHRDELIHADDRQRIEFVRAVRDGRVTDEMWEALKTEIGERGVVEFVHFVLFVEYYYKFGWAIGAKEVSYADFDKMLSDFKSGARKPPERKSIVRSGGFTASYSCSK
jgi:hypothetical protein